MALQSQAPAILLTRPLPQSQRFARSLRAGFGAPLHIVISPLMQAVYLSPPIAMDQPAGLIFSSETAVSAYARLPLRQQAPAWCIGARTAKAAQVVGLLPALIARDAADLLTNIMALRPDGPFLHLRGQDRHGNIAASLTAAGIPTTEAVVYAQMPQPMSKRALRLLGGDGASVTVPLFSARSAMLFAAQLPLDARLNPVALSPAVAAALPAALRMRARVAPTPDAAGMLKTVIDVLCEQASP